jgi:molybdopterin synthase sulfur carrier subunit
MTAPKKKKMPMAANPLGRIWSEDFIVFRGKEFLPSTSNIHRDQMNPRPSLWHHVYPMPKIQIPTPLRQYAGKQPAVDVKAGTIGEALSDLVARHPDLRRHLYTDDGKLRSFVNVYLNDEDVRYLQKEATAVKDSDSISIVPSIAGGRD